MEGAQRRHSIRYAVVAALILGGLYLASTRCAPTPNGLERAARGKAGVLKVEVVGNGGEADIPFSTLPQLVTVTMRSSATEAQVQDVVDEYERDLGRDYVELLTIKLEGEVGGALELVGRPGKNYDPFVTAFVAAAHQPGAENVALSTDFNNSMGPDLYSHFAALTLRSDGFERVHEAFNALEPLMVRNRISFTVSSDGLRLKVARPPSARDRAQIRLAAAVDAKFTLVGADVVGHRQMKLRVPGGTDVSAVRALIRQLAPRSAAGTVAVATGGTVDLAGAPSAQVERARLVVNRLRFQGGFRAAVYRNGELRITTTNLDMALGVDGVTESSLGSEPASYPDFEAAYLPLTVRYVVPDGTQILKKPGATVSSYLNLFELHGQGWVRITGVATPSEGRFRLHAPRSRSRADAKFYANLHQGRAGNPPVQIAVVWPAVSRQEPLEISGPRLGNPSWH